MCSTLLQARGDVRRNVGVLYRLLQYLLSAFGIEHELFDSRPAEFDLNGPRPGHRSRGRYFAVHLSRAADACSIATCRTSTAKFELPQAFFRQSGAMGLAVNEIDREGHAIEFPSITE